MSTAPETELVTPVRHGRRQAIMFAGVGILLIGLAQATYPLEVTWGKDLAVRELSPQLRAAREYMVSYAADAPAFDSTYATVPKSGAAFKDYTKWKARQLGIQVPAWLNDVTYGSSNDGCLWNAYTNGNGVTRIELDGTITFGECQ